MSTVWTVFTGRWSRSSSLMGTYFPLVYSNPRTTSSQGTAFSSLGHQRTFCNRTPSRLCNRWKCTSCDWVAVYKRTGMLTSPNEIVPLQMARADLGDSPLPDVSLSLSFPPPPGGGRVGGLLRVVVWAI